MKFLVIFQPKGAVPSDITERNKKIVEQAIKDDKILEMYYVPGWNKHVSIEEHDNAEAMLEQLQDNYIYGDVEIYPLVDYKASRFMK